MNNPKKLAVDYTMKLLSVISEELKVKENEFTDPDDIVSFFEYLISAVKTLIQNYEKQ